ncbi:MAG: hypothetical protein DMG80_10975 [Acidobacteria bacterium]|nr:MAG: hypothetical protein DMG80_10975 [Acidobacteriota bacterium]
MRAGSVCPVHNLEDQIQALIAQAISARDSADLDGIIRQLRAALRQHTARLRKLAASSLVVNSPIEGSADHIPEEPAAGNDIGTE